MMMENYRSTPEILAACNSLIAKNANRIKKDLLPMLPDGAPVLCHHAANSEQEARWIAAQIKTLHEAGTPYRDMAVLYRAHYITRGVEEILLKEKIPYTIYSGVQFFARAEIKDALSYLRMIACRDDLSFLRIANVPKRNLGERRMAFLKDYAAQNGCSLYDALRRNLDSELLRGTKAGKFVSLIERFTGVYDQMPVSELQSYLDAAYGKAEQLKTLTDELFRYSLLFGCKELPMQMEIYDARLLLEQLLGESRVQLQQQGFMVQLLLPQQEVQIEADVTYLKRVFDNLFDNIRKYADPARPVAIAALLEDGALHVCLSNSVNPASGRIESNKIGLRTCAKIMAQMAGGFKRYTENGKFTAEVILPIRAAEVSS